MHLQTMGSSESKNTATIISESVIESVTEMEAHTLGAQGQKIDISGLINNSNVNITQSSDLMLKSIANFTLTQDLLNKIMDKIKQTADAEGMLLSGTMSNNETNVRQILETKVNTKLSFNCGLTSAQAIAITKDAIINNSKVNVNQVAIVAQECGGNFLSQFSGLTDLTTKMDSETSSKTNLLNFGIGAVVIMIVLAILAYFFMSSKKPKMGGKYKKDHVHKGGCECESFWGFMRN
jgi:anaerobic C4-dicarboxylate transporter